MSLVKNVEPYSIDVGGRALAPGEGPIDLDANEPAVAEQIELGHLVLCVQPPTPEQSTPAAGGASASTASAPSTDPRAVTVASAPAEES